MDISSINNNVSNLNTVPQAHVDKANSSKSVEAVNPDDALNLSISQIYNKKRDELSHSLQNLNEGIAASEITINALDKQEKIVKNIEDELYKLKASDNSDDKRFETAQNIVKELENFNKIVENTTFRKQQLLTSDDTEVLNITTKTNNFKISSVNTSAISEQLSQTLQTNNLSSDEEINQALYGTREALEKISNFTEEFNKVEEKIEQNARETLDVQIKMAQENSRIKGLDFGQEVADFSKTNISSHVGYLAASQANIVQAQSVKLLS